MERRTSKNKPNNIISKKELMKRINNAQKPLVAHVENSLREGKFGKPSVDALKEGFNNLIKLVNSLDRDIENKQQLQEFCKDVELIYKTCKQRFRNNRHYRIESPLLNCFKNVTAVLQEARKSITDTYHLPQTSDNEEQNIVTLRQEFSNKGLDNLEERIESLYTRIEEFLFGTNLIKELIQYSLGNLMDNESGINYFSVEDLKKGSAELISDFLFSLRKYLQKSYKNFKKRPFGEFRDDLINSVRGFKKGLNGNYNEEVTEGLEVFVITPLVNYLKNARNLGLILDFKIQNVSTELNPEVLAKLLSPLRASLIIESQTYELLPFSGEEKEAAEQFYMLSHENHENSLKKTAKELNRVFHGGLEIRKMIDIKNLFEEELEMEDKTTEGLKGLNGEQGIDDLEDTAQIDLITLGIYQSVVRNLIYKLNKTTTTLNEGLAQIKKQLELLHEIDDKIDTMNRRFEDRNGKLDELRSLSNSDLH